MRLVFSDADLVLNGVSYSELPIILEDSGTVAKVATDFLIYYCIVRGRVESKNSWAVYGQAIYDYLSFLDSSGKCYSDFLFNKHHSIIAAYRDWSLRVVNLSPNTVNLRLRVIVKFYEHLMRCGYIEYLPFDLEEVRVPRVSESHTRSIKKTQVITSPNIFLKSRNNNEAFRYLDRLQVERLIKSTVKHSTINTMVRLALQTGLRRSELISFPIGYVFDPSDAPSDANVFKVKLEASEMRLKGNRSRTIFISSLLMKRLWHYRIYDRPKSRSELGELSDQPLFLTKFGEPYSEKTTVFNYVLRRRLGISAGAHILRHTYATYTLYELTMRKTVLDPLLYVRDRLGHASVTTTEKYLHSISELEIEVMERFDYELDRL